MLNFKEIERQSKEVWKKHKKEIEKAIQNNPKKKLFSFLEGPPTANAPPGLHHLESRTFKDIICKFKYMQGFSVPRKGGWDCHGLPVEVQVEKKLNLDSKKDVEKYGMDKFIKQCREDVFCNIEDWNKSTEEVGYWIDLKNPYVTLENDYIESVWWSLKELYNKKLLYEGHKVVPFCPRCGTPLSSHEVAQGYKDINEDSVYIAFKLKNEKNSYMLAWTTTPWTLPGNVALAVGSNIDYVKVKLPDGDTLILGKDRLKILNLDYKIIKELKGKDLIGLEYEPLYDIKETQNNNSHKIILADFVTTEDGTGVVHIAGMYGEDDYNICKKNNLPLVHTVGEDGKFLDIVPKFLSGKFVKHTEKDIIEDLRKRHLLLKKEKITHPYPFCWRCDSPLLYYAINSWYIKVTAIRNKLIKLNKKINWVPKHIKDGRFGKWLEGAKDWALSRFKFWGTPLPIWRCECGKEKIIGGINDLKKNSSKKIKKIELHKPYIDKIKLKCKCGKEMKRIPDVIDCWYDSGAASFAQFHYPFENKKEFEKRFPYDYIAEAIDQTRGWFYTLHVLATILFEKPAFKNVICMGHILDEKGEKMSKSKGNILAPNEMIDAVGVDAIRLQFCVSDPGNPKRFSINMVKENVSPFLNVLYNCMKFYQQSQDKKISYKLEDKWILSKLNSLIKKTTKDLENYSIDKALLGVMDFLTNDFSRTYIKITRDRNDNKKILGEVLKKVSLLLAPYAPYISEYIYQNFEKDSVHLSKWPKIENKKINNKLEKEFAIALDIIEKGLAERDKVKVGLKWPLAKVIVKTKDSVNMELREIIIRQLNVKKIKIEKTKDKEKTKEISIKLDTEMTPELEAEGYAREISRKVQATRKKAGLIKSDNILLGLVMDADLTKLIESQVQLIKERTNSQDVFIRGINEEKQEEFQNKSEERIKGKNIKILFDKV